jgi:acyl transferase domain-containing protein
LALRDAGVEYRGQDVGCFMAAVQHDLFMLSEQVKTFPNSVLPELTVYQDEAEAQGSFATGPAMVANRVSYHLDLRGPSVPVDTACSSTLGHPVVELGRLHISSSRRCPDKPQVRARCSAISQKLNGSRFTEWLQYSVGGIASADGKCKPFDASADG